MPSNIDLNWDGVINRSALVVANQMIHWDKQVKIASSKVIYSVVVATVLFLTFLLINGFHFLQWFDNAYFLTAVIAAYLACLHYVKIKAAAEKKFQSFRELLMKKIDADFCNCKSSCNHKEEFMEYIQEEQGINIYY